MVSNDDEFTIISHNIWPFNPLPFYPFQLSDILFLSRVRCVKQMNASGLASGRCSSLQGAAEWLLDGNVQLLFCWWLIDGVEPSTVGHAANRLPPSHPILPRIIFSHTNKLSTRFHWIHKCLLCFSLRPPASAFPSKHHVTCTHCRTDVRDQKQRFESRCNNRLF